MDFKCSFPKELVRVWYQFKWFFKLYNLRYSDSFFFHCVQKSKNPGIHRTNNSSKITCFLKKVCFGSKVLKFYFETRLQKIILSLSSYLKIRVDNTTHDLRNIFCITCRCFSSMWWRYGAISAFLWTNIQTALERHHVVGETCPLYFWNEYNHSFQMSHYKELAYAYSILMKLRGRPKNA